MTKNHLLQPCLKWVGGKRQLIQEIDKYFPSKYSKYYEPFIGGGAVLFHFQPKRAIINDTNSELINFYNVVKNDVEALIQDLKKHKNEEDYFYTIRELDRKHEFENMTDVQKASRLHYLNKTCYNGLFRVNSAGQFNSPYGKYKNPNIVNESILRAVSNYFNKNDIKILNTDFEESIKGIRKGALVYFDPPYDPVSSSSSFTGYTENGFNRDEQIRLKNLCDKLDKKGVKFLLSNSATPFIKDLYKEYDIITVQAKRSINSKGSGRGEIDEVLVKNYD